MALTAWLAIAAAASSVPLDDFTDQLRWAPLVKVKTPFLSFLNDFNFPSWRTRNPLTKQPDFSRENEPFRVPRGVPLALVCGACFHRSLAHVNFTIECDAYNITTVPQLVPPDLVSDQFSIRGGLVCMMTYFVTSPIEHGGNVTCVLHRGTQKIVEVVYVDTVEPRVIGEEDTNKMYQEPLQLRCCYNISKPLGYVWCYNDDVPIPYTKSTIQLHTLIDSSSRLLPSSLQIICYAYNALGDLCITRYNISGMGGNMVNIATSTKSVTHPPPWFTGIKCIIHGECNMCNIITYIIDNIICIIFYNLHNVMSYFPFLFTPLLFSMYYWY